MRLLRRWLPAGLVAAAALGIAPPVPALTLTIQQQIPIGGTAYGNAEGIAVIYSGANEGIYVPHRDSSNVTVLNRSTGAELYTFNSGIAGGNLRSIDVLPNGNLLIGQHTTQIVREVVIPGAAGNTTFGEIQFTVPFHPDPPPLGQVFDEFESLTPFAAPNGDIYILLGEEGRDSDGDGQEEAGEVYIGRWDGDSLEDFHELFQVPLADNLDDISGMDIVNLAFNGDELDLANTTIIMSDDSSGTNSSAFILNLEGDILEVLVDPITGDPVDFESLFQQAFDDAEGVDYFDPPGAAPPIYTLIFGDGDDGVQHIVSFIATIENPVPEPAAAVLLGLGLGGLALLRRRD